ncbi:MAG: hypothetical protein K2K93_07070 [Muribaculaceae bacterium]|nr:hypothetical protein [Muribaculaceae bacterium]
MSTTLFKIRLPVICCNDNASELLTGNGLNEYDFGARRYYSAVPHFTSPDPLCENFRHLSPYLYCANDPVNKIDPTGMIWNDPKEAEELIKDINKKISSYQNDVDELSEKINNGKSNSKVESKVADLKKRILLMQKALSDIDLLAKDDKYTYAFSHNDGSGENSVRLGDDGIVYIETSDNALSVHEITHVRQYKEASTDGSLDFNSKGLLKNAGTREKNPSIRIQHISDNEVEAYQMQFAYNPHSMPNKAKDIGSIDLHYVGSIKNGIGQPVYDIINRYSEFLKKQMRFNCK